MGALYTLYEREMRKWFRQKVQLVFVVLMPLMWMGLFGKSLNFSALLRIPDIPGAEQLRNQIQLLIEEYVIKRYFGGYDYFSFFVIGMLSVFILFTTMWSGMSLVFDRRLGYLNRFLVAPIPRSSIVMSKILSSVTRSLIQVTALLIIALALGLSLKTGVGVIDIAILYGVITLLAVSFSSIFTAIAVRITSHDLVISIANLVNLPLMFTSNAMFPVEQMPQYLQIIARANPITHANVITRYYLLGVGDPGSVVISTIYMVLFAAASIAIAIIASRKIE
ncbi:MAG TPA: ABC transporter permease [Sulfolobales archaeon]|nr:ABC transporter permease [Sulfolobales archaeon]